jgi:spermidine synthase
MTHSGDADSHRWPAPGPGARALVLALLFLSGACALTYEVVWMRMLILVFGATTFAASTILASFFGGLALGGAWFGRLIDRGRNPLLVYALLEFGMAACAFAMPWVFQGIESAYVGVSRTFGVGYDGLSLTRFTFSFVALIIPATLMGGTMPVMLKYLIHDREGLGSRISLLYAANTFGAMAGAFLAGFFLILILGVREAAYLAGFVNLAIGLATLGLWRRVSRAEAGPPPVEALGLENDEASRGGAVVAEPAAAMDRTPDPAVLRVVLLAIAASGFCALALEVLWTRSLVFFLDNSTHAFSTILVAFLLGIALGSLVVVRFADRLKRPVLTLGILQLLIGFSALAALPLLSAMPSVFDSILGASVDALLPVKWTAARLLNAMLVLFVPTLLMGMSFPLAVKIYSVRVERIGTSAGDIYAVNTLGGVLGSLAAGFLLIPLLGVVNSIALIAAVNLAAGLGLVLTDRSVGARARWGGATAAVVVFGALAGFSIQRGPDNFVSYYERLEDPQILSYHEGAAATVKVYEDGWGNRTISVNGFPVAGTEITMQDAQKTLAHLPMLISPVPSPTVKIIGFGAGGTSWGMSRYEVERIDCVELVQGVPAQAGFFPEVNHDIRSEPRFNLIFGDGRNHSLISEEVYDIISVDATSPKMAGNGSLYSVEFYELLARSLSEEGIAVQWIPFHLLSESETRMIARSFVEVFPHATLWFTPLRQYFVLVGSADELSIDYAFLAEKLARPEVQEDLAPLSVTSPVDVLGLFVMGEEGLANWVDGALVNSDNHPYLEFLPALAYFVSDLYWVANTGAALERRESVTPYLTNMGDSPEEVAALEDALDRRLRATQHSIRGDILSLIGEDAAARREYLEALRIDPSDINQLRRRYYD